MAWLDRYFSELGSFSTVQPNHDINIATILESAAFDPEIATDPTGRNELLARVILHLEACRERLGDNTDMQMLHAVAALAFAYERCGRLQDAKSAYVSLRPIYEGLTPYV